MQQSQGGDGASGDQAGAGADDMDDGFTVVARRRNRFRAGDGATGGIASPAKTDEEGGNGD